jgi:capsular polysaccharide biosynthesis protein
MGINSSFDKDEDISLSQVTQMEDEVYFFLYNTKNYFHFLYDSLPYLWFYFKQELTCPILVQQELLPFVKETFELLGLTSRLLVAKTDTLYKNVYVSSSLTHNGCSNLPYNKEFKDIIERLKVSASLRYNYPTPKKIYVSRRTSLFHTQTNNIGTDYTQRRICRNEDEIVDFLSQKGYEEVFPERWTMIQKIHTFSNATHVIGLIGGGVCNLLFSPLTTQSIVIVSPTFLDINFRFQFSLNHTLITYFTTTHLDKIKDTDLSLYIRAKVVETGEIGEIVNANSTHVELTIVPRGRVYVLQQESKTQWFRLEEVQVLDKGLNSPFFLDINKFKLLWSI